MKIKKGRIKCSSTELNLGITLHGGQSFRWVTHERGYLGVFKSNIWMITQDETHLSYTVQGSRMKDIDYDTIISDYFRLDVSLENQYKNWAAADKHFNNMQNGVRILNQDVVENLFSFICSSNNNIQRISKMVEKLCVLFGAEIDTLHGKPHYDFPLIEHLTQGCVEDVLRKEGFGYRAAYIANTAKQLQKLGGRQWLLNLHKDNNTSYSTAREQLLGLPGVGPKVADCVCLMSLGHLEAIPVDTHIFQVARSNYLPHLSKQKTVTPKIHDEVSNHLRKIWGPLAGWAQAVVFCAKINNNTDLNINRKRKQTRTTAEVVPSKR